MPINQTINQTITDTGLLEGITFESWIEISTSLPFIIGVVAVILIPFLLYLIIGALTKTRTPSGKKLDTVMIQNPNFWIPVIIYFLLQSALIVILLLYPFWIKFIT